MPAAAGMAESHSIVDKAACGGWGRHCRPVGPGCAGLVGAGALPASTLIVSKRAGPHKFGAASFSQNLFVMPRMPALVQKQAGVRERGTSALP